MLKKKALAAAVASLGLAMPVAQADEAASPITGNLTFTTDYIVRGLSQTGNSPALQGTIEYGHSSGLYLGGFASNVSWPADFFGPTAPGANPVTGGGPNTAISNSLEIDIYGGFRNKFAGDFSYDVGAVYYYYPGRYNLDTSFVPGLKKPHTGEIYGALGWKWITAKVWYAVTDGVFMVGDARGTYYANLGANVPIGDTGFNLVAGVGTWKWNGEMQLYKNNGDKNEVFDLVDWKLGATKDWGGFTWGLFYTGSTAEAYTSNNALSVWTDRFGKEVGKDTVFLSVTKAF